MPQVQGHIARGQRALPSSRSTGTLAPEPSNYYDPSVFTMTLPSSTLSSVEPVLGIAGFSYRDLHDARRLPELAQRFYEFAQKRASAEAWARFDRYRSTGGEGMAPEEISEAIVAIAPFLGSFVAHLFGIEEERLRLIENTEREAVVFRFKREFVKKRTAKRKKSEIDALEPVARQALDAAARGSCSW